MNGADPHSLRVGAVLKTDRGLGAPECLAGELDGAASGEHFVTVEVRAWHRGLETVLDKPSQE